MHSTIIYVNQKAYQLILNKLSSSHNPDAEEQYVFESKTSNLVKIYHGKNFSDNIEGFNIYQIIRKTDCNELNEIVTRFIKNIKQFKDKYSQELVSIFTKYKNGFAFGEMYSEVRDAGKFNKKRFVQLWDVKTRNLFLQLIYPD